MKLTTLAILATFGTAFAAELKREIAENAATHSVVSPDGRLKAVFSTDAGGMRWSLLRDGKMLVKPSVMGFRFAVGNHYDKDSVELAEMKVVGVKRSSSDAVWATKLYRRSKVRDRYNELVVELEEVEARAVRVGLGKTVVEKSPRRMDIVFRAYDEGVAFRYSFPHQIAFEGFQIKDELTEWRFASDVMAWTTTYAVEQTSQERSFVRSPIAEIDGSRYIGMPVLVETQGSVIALCEAALSNWAGLFYRKVHCDGEVRLVAALSKIPPSPAATADVAVIATAPTVSPWRVAIVGDDELDLIRKNDIIVNLNPPPDPSIDFSFVKSGLSTWDWWVESNNSLSTELTIKLVDFAAEMGWSYHTIDGGWYGFARRPNHGPNVRLEPRKGFDLERIVAHAKEKGVGIWVWIHWMQIRDVGIEETFSRLEKWGVVGVKTDFLDRQDQEMVNWCERVCRAAARHRIMVNFHGSFKATGTERTWPNMITREAVRGNEMNIFSKTVTPTHCATLPFTRFLLGPADFTPGGFGNVYSRDFVPQVKKGHRYGDETDRCPHWAEEMGTRAHAIAQCIQFDSPLMTLCDWPDRYRGADGIEALRRLPAAWKDTRPVAGRCGEFYAVVREAHDGRFYFAATTVDARTVDLPLDFLVEGEWKMTVYVDDPVRTPSDAKAISIVSRTVRKGGTERFAMCAEGGAVAVFERFSACYPPVSNASPRLAFQVYAVRNLCEKDFPGTLKAVKALGYEGVETGRFYGRSAKEIRSLMDEVGLKLVALQLYPDDLTEPKLRETLRFTKECGTDRINVAWFKGSSENHRDWHLLVNVVNHAAEVAAKEGITIGYHNHDQEFRTQFNGKYVWDWLWERFSPLVKQEFDAGWCALAGVDPHEVLRRYPNRNPTVHVMPAIFDKTGLKPGSAGVGSVRDKIDWQKLASEFAADGTQWFVVKPVAFPDSLEDLKASIEYLKKDDK